MSNYKNIVKEARKDFLKVVDDQEKELIKIYSKAAKDIEIHLKKTSKGSITERYLKALKVEVNNYIKILRKELKENISNNIDNVSKIATEIQLNFFDKIVPTLELKQSFKNMFLQLSDDVVKRMLSGKYYSDKQSLDNRIWNLTSHNAKKINEIIILNIAKGANAKELSKLLNTFINPNKVLIKHSNADKLGIKISYQAARLARTSLTHAYTETLKEESLKNPFVKGLKWNNSPSHYDRQIKKFGEDMCTWNKGKIFKPDQVPLQHPNCLCYLTPEIIPIEEARKELYDWINGKDNKVLDDWLDKYGKQYGIEV